MNSKSLLFKALEYYGTQIDHRGKWIIHNFLRKLFNVDVDEDLEVERKNLRWLLNPRDYVHQDVFWYGTKDYWDVYHLSKYINAGDTIFDIGANFGYYSIFLASLLKKKCSLYSFEPLPQTFARFQKNIILNEMADCINAFQIGLSDCTMKLPISTRVLNNSGSSSFVASCNDENTTVYVDVVLLDDFIDDNNITQLNMIKIDVEGYELKVLKGGEKSLKKHKPVIFMEIDPPLLNRAGITVEELTGLVNSNGYHIYASNREVLVPYVHNRKNETYVNVICLQHKI